MNRGIVMLAFIIVFAFLIQAAVEMRDFGEPVNTAMDDHMITQGQVETGANNIVTAVVFDYRGFDTLGEATVLFTAVSSVFMVLRRRKEEDEEESSKDGEDESPDDGSPVDGEAMDSEPVPMDEIMDTIEADAAPEEVPPEDYVPEEFGSDEEETVIAPDTVEMDASPGGIEPEEVRL